MPEIPYLLQMLGSTPRKGEDMLTLNQHHHVGSQPDGTAAVEHAVVTALQQKSTQQLALSRGSGRVKQ